MNVHSEFGYFPERRLKPRFTCDYPAEIKGYDENGKVFHVKGRAVNLSRNGVNLALDKEIPCGTELSISLVFNTNSLKLGTSTLVVHGTVVRGESHSDKTYNIAVKFQEYRFI
jgi:PilZ domain